MALADLLQQDAVVPALRVNSKKQLLQELAAKASKLTDIPEREIFDVILQRERLGSTGVGNGIAIPHGKLNKISKITGIFARLETPVDFEALDDQPVDLVFLLLAPETAGADHLTPRQIWNSGAGSIRPCSIIRRARRMSPGLKTSISGLTPWVTISAASQSTRSGGFS